MGTELLPVEEPRLDPAEALVSAACDELLDRIVAKAEPRIRKHTDAVYEDLLISVQEYLKSNANWNLAQEIERCRRVDAENRSLIEQRGELVHALNGVLGLVQLLCARPDITQDARDVIERSFRMTAARDAIARATTTTGA